MTKENTLKIGFDEGNDIKIKHESVSKIHAYLKMLDNHKFELQDAGSINGIHVNNRRVKNKIIDEKDQVIIGGHEINTADILAQAKNIILDRRTDFSKEYTTIVEKIKSYSQKREKLNNVNKIGNMSRIGGSIILILILVFKPDLIPDPTIRYILIMAVGLIPVIIGMFSEKGEKKRAKLELLKLDYEEETKCPKCNISLLRHTPEYLVQRKRCPNEKCNVTFTVL